MEDEWKIRLEERRRCTKLCRKMIQIDPQELIKAIADLKTADPVHGPPHELQWPQTAGREAATSP